MNKSDRWIYGGLLGCLSFSVFPPLFSKLFALFPLTSQETLVLWGLFVLGVLLSLKVALSNRPIPKLLCGAMAIVLSLGGLELSARLTVNRLLPQYKKETVKLGLIAYPELWRYQGHPFAHFRGNPNYLFQKDWVNAAGFYPKYGPKQTGVVRIACLGASTSKNYPNVLQQILDSKAPPNTRFEVLNFSLDGYSTVHSLINFVLHIVDQSVDAIVFHHAPLGMPEGSGGNYSTVYRPFTPNVPIDVTLIKASVVYREIRHRLVPIPGWYGHQFSVIHSVEDFSQLPEMEPYERNLKTILDVAIGRDIFPILTTHPYDHRYPRDAGTALMEQANAAVERLAARYGDRVALVDIDAAMEGRDLFADREHMKDERGPAIKAQLIAEPLLHHFAVSSPKGPLS